MTSRLDHKTQLRFQLESSETVTGGPSCHVVRKPKPHIGRIQVPQPAASTSSHT